MSEQLEALETTDASDASSARDADDAIIDAWFAKHFHNLGAGISEQLYNRIYAAKDDLKAMLTTAAPPPS